MTTTINISTGSLTFETSALSVQSVLGGSSASPGAIARDGVVTIVLATTDTGTCIQLPSGAQVGDYFEVYKIGSCRLFAPSGESATNGVTEFTPNLACRKVGSTTWGVLNG